MEVKDRERLALSTGIALAGYVVIYLLLTGLHWPPEVAVRTISPPVSVYVDLQGSTQSEAPGTPRVAAAQPPRPTPLPATPEATQAATAPGQKARATPTPPAAATVQSPPSTQSSPAAAQQSSSATSTQSATSTPAPTPSSQTTSSPPMPTSMTSSAGPTPSPGGTTLARSGGASKSGAPLSGAASPTPGVTYPPGVSPEASPPQGSGGTGSQSDQGQSQTFYGPNAKQTGSIFNPQLAESAGASSGSTTGSPSGASAAGPAGSASGQAAAQSSQGAAGATSQGGAAGTGSSGGAQTGSGGGTAGSAPKIEWKGKASSRTVSFQPDPLVIPKQYLSELPPSAALKIDFQVAPDGTVKVLNITGPLVYPQLRNLLETWMEEWSFEPVSGSQVAEGTLEYVIRAETAR